MPIITKATPPAPLAPPPPPVAPARPNYSRKVLIEGLDGAPATEGDHVVQWHERKFTHQGRHFEHVSEEGDYWVYREMP